MTTKPKPQGSYCLAASAFAVGLFLGGLCLFANFQFGHSLGLSETGKLTQSGLSVGIDLGFAVAAAATGWLLRRRSLACVMTGMVAAVFGFYTLMSLVGWSASERVAKADKIFAEAQAERDLAEETNALIRKERNELLSWARNTTAERMPTARRREILTTLKDVMDAPPKLQKVIDIENVAADAQSDVLAKALAAVKFEVDRRNVLLFMILFLATLAIIGKGFFLALGAYLWPVRDIANRDDNGRTRELTQVDDIARSARSLPHRADNDVEPTAISSAGLATSQETAAVDIASREAGARDIAQRPAMSTVDIASREVGSRDIAQPSGLSAVDIASAEGDARDIANLVVSAIETEHGEKGQRRLTAAERQSQLGLVKLFLDEETTPARGARQRATFFHDLFNRWAARKGLGIEMSLNVFGAICAELGVQKLHNRRHVYYLDLAPVSDVLPAGEVPEAAAA